MKSLLFPCLVVAALTAVRATAADPEEFESEDIEYLLSDEDSTARPAKRSFFDLPEYAISFGESVVPVNPALGSEDDSAEYSEVNDLDFLGDECYVPPNCKRKGEITFQPGFRIQSRYQYDDINNQNDFFIRRTRLKGSGKAFDIATYGLELRFDGTERFDNLVPVTVKDTVENAWVSFKLIESNAYLKVGLYDIPFCRSVLTSDSKILLMDRTITSGALTAIGMADNTVGVTLHGRPLDGQLEYAFGVYDNIRFDRVGKNSNGLMPAGRVAWYLLDPATNGNGAVGKPDGYADYKGSYLGQGNKLVLGAQFATLPNVREGAPLLPASEFDVNAWGVDVFYNSGPWVFEADYSWFMEDKSLGGPDLRGEGWTVQGGYILDCCLELVARYQDLDDPITPFNGSTGHKWTSVGANYYFHEHNLKVQTDYTWKNESGVELDNDIFEVQLQLDF